MENKLGLIDEKITLKDCQVKKGSNNKLDYLNAINNYLNLIPSLIPLQNVTSTSLKDFLLKNNLQLLNWDFFSPNSNLLSWTIHAFIVYDNNDKKKKIIIYNASVNSYSFLSNRFSLFNLSKVYNMLVDPVEYQHLFLKCKKRTEQIIELINQQKFFLKKKDNLYEKISITSYNKKLNHISYIVTKIGYDKGKKKWYFLTDTQYSNNEMGVNKALIKIIKDLNSHKKMEGIEVTREITEFTQKQFDEMNANNEKIFAEVLK